MKKELKGGSSGLGGTRWVAGIKCFEGSYILKSIEVRNNRWKKAPYKAKGRPVSVKSPEESSFFTLPKLGRGF